jgi:ATPases of the AAA+ class
MAKTPTIAASEADLMRSVRMLSDAGAAVLQIRTREPYRAALALRRSFLVGKDASPYREWDCINGMRMFTAENFTDPMVPASNPSEPMNDLYSALNLINSMRRDQHSDLYVNNKALHYFVYINPAPFLQQPPLIELVCQLANSLPTSNVCVLLVTADEPLSGIPQGMLQVTSLATPSAEELIQITRNLLQDAGRHSESVEAFQDGMDIADEDLARIAHMGAGMTAFEFETYAAIAVIEAQSRADNQLTAEVLMEGISKGKTEIVKQSDMLELMAPTAIDEVGGMEGLKEWLLQRTDCFSEEAREFGIETPKGIAVVGLPGSGKSLIGKAIANVFNLPLVRFDISAVFSKFVGDSEQRMRSALKLVESMSPLVLLIDEVDKAMGGMGGSNDGGASSRVFGTFLTWLQECKSPVFTIVTANRVNGMPPEFLRKGRFDQVFSVGMPDAMERSAVLRVHLAKRGRAIDDFNAADLSAFSAKSNGYVPAEIEAAVKDGLILAFHAHEELQMRHILAALEDTVPMSVSNAAQVNEIVEWARHNATPVTKKPTAATPIAGNVRRMRTRTPTQTTER